MSKDGINILQCFVEGIRSSSSLYINAVPSEECECTANWTGAHIWDLQWAHFEDTHFAHSELTRLLTLWACCELSMSLQLARWAHCYHCMVSHQMISWIAHSKRNVWVANSYKAHRKLTVWVILWVHCEVNECPQNEPTVSFNVSSLWVSCELKFFTG